MQKYMQKTKFSEFLDRLGLMILCFLVSEAFFVKLWGFKAPSLIAGLFFFFLVFLFFKSGQDAKNQEKTTLLQKTAGGEKALKHFMLADPKEAQNKIFDLIASSRHWQKAGLSTGGILFLDHGEKMLFVFFQRHESETVFPHQIYDLQRQALLLKIKKIFLCTPAVLSPDAARAADGFPKVCAIGKKQLTEILGTAFPVSEKEARRFLLSRPSSLSKWYENALSLSHMPRYLSYSFWMMCLFFITRFYIYAFFSVLLFLFSVGCRILFFRKKKEKRRSFQ